MNDTLRACLVQAGWRDGRRRPTGDDALRLAASGFTMFAAAREFLERFGGLVARGSTTQPRGSGIYFRTDADAVSPADAAEGRIVEEACGTHVCPIGTTAYGDYTLYIDEHGRMFGVDLYGGLTFWGEDTVELLETVFGLGPIFRPVDADDHRPIAPGPAR